LLKEFAPKGKLFKIVKHSRIYFQIVFKGGYIRKYKKRLRIFLFGLRSFKNNYSEDYIKAQLNYTDNIIINVSSNTDFSEAIGFRSRYTPLAHTNFEKELTMENIYSFIRDMEEELIEVEAKYNVTEIHSI
jgi:hypothetical protein